MFEAASMWQWRAHMVAFAPSNCAADDEKDAYRNSIAQVGTQTLCGGYLANSSDLIHDNIGGI